jgi:hypothetical protein
LPETEVANLIVSDKVAYYQRAWYRATVEEFIASTATEILGCMAKVNPFVLQQTQRDAWLVQTSILQKQLDGLSGEVFLEYSIPRMGRRIDAVLIIGPGLFVLEFKVGEATFDRVSVEQVWDYALDLKNFHSASHTLAIVPVLIATEASGGGDALLADLDGVYRPTRIGRDALRGVLDRALAHIGGPHIDVEAWSHSPYRPTPTIIEAARALYAQHSVEEIARFDAGAQNLARTSARIESLVEQARRGKQKVICFVTGVPGAGKTLVGLNIATHKRQADEASHAVFLSGNAPLVAVLREALTRDEVKRKAALGEKVRKSQVGESVKAFIQNVHHFRDDALADLGPPSEHVVIFDEAQRAWNLRKTATFMKMKKGRPNFSQSEPEFLISCFDRRNDWALIVCLVGGGQEINDGEAGIGAWIEAMREAFPKWRVCISDRLVDSEYAAGDTLVALASRENVTFDEDLHLAISMRSFRAERVSDFVKALLDCEGKKAQEMLAALLARYPIKVTRDLGRAKDWIRAQARGSERYGLVASSKAQRLKPHAIDIRVNVDPVHWFLDDRADTRSSYYLEDAATEFQVQGLELDWACVTWDGDLRFAGDGWSFHDFRGSKWTNVKNLENRNYLRNAYRVLLTRARQGMVIFIPRGEESDPTRSPGIYDATFNYLRDVGVPVLT